MLDTAALLNDISVAFIASSNLRTLAPRLSEALARHLPLVEVEIAMLDRDGSSVQLAAHAPTSRRPWRGRRSARFLAKQWVGQPTWCDELEPARVAISPVSVRLKLPAGRHGLLCVAFGNDISVYFGEGTSTEILVKSISMHCRRLGQLDATARLCRAAYRNTGEVLEQVSEKNTEISVDEITDISVNTVEVATRQCISRALHASHGRIYGDRGAAKLLGLKPSTLQSKMRKLGVERRDFVG
jgi:hypothetical protein